MYRSMFVAVLVILVATVAFAATPDSLTVKLNSGNDTTVAVTEDVAKTLYNVGEEKAAEAILCKIQVAEKFAAFEKEKKAEAEKKFWVDVKAARKEIKRDMKFTELMEWADTKEKCIAALQFYGVSKWCINTDADVDELKSQISAVVMTVNVSAKQTRKQAKRFKEALAGKADTAMVMNAVANLEVCIQENSDNINVLRENLNQTAINALAALSAVDFSKIHKKAKDDAIALRKRCERNAAKNYQPIEFGSDN